jgi:hypothetical protein
VRGLRGFEKVFLMPGESAVVTLDIARGPSPRAACPDERPRSAGSAPAAFDANSTLGDMRKTPVGMALYFIVRFVLTLVYGTGAAGRRMTDSIVNETPLRTLSAMSGGLLPRPLINALIALSPKPVRRS